MDAFVVATRIPTLLRDLFAEGAMSAAFVPTFTRYLTATGKGPRGGSDRRSSTACSRHRHAGRHSGSSSPSPITRFVRRPTDLPASSSSTHSLTRINMPFLLLVAVAAAYMGMLNALKRFFIPAHVAGDVQRRVHRLRDAARPAVRRLGLPADHGAGDRHARAAASRRSSCSGRRCGARAIATSGCSIRATGAARGAGPDGSRHDRRRRGADQPVRQHRRSRPAPTARASALSVRLPADVPADRHFRRVGGDGQRSRIWRGRRRRRARRDAADDCPGPPADAHAQRAGDRRADGARRSRSSSWCSRAARSTPATTQMTLRRCSSTRQASSGIRS